MWELLKNVNLSALAKALEEVGKSFLTIGVMSIVFLIFQPLVKGNTKFIITGGLIALLSFLLGFTLIYTAEILKED
ncbi:MAG TPA: hypothetical protein EYO62_02820 [Aquificales bacterium]|nr:hypothetical protein [Aquificales bacterium]